MGMTRIVGGVTTVTRHEEHNMKKLLKNGEDFFFEVPKHPANHLFAGRLQRLGFQRSSPISYDEYDRFYMPKGTDVEQVKKEYLEYFSEGEAPEVNIIPLGFLTPSVEHEPVIKNVRQLERETSKKPEPREPIAGEWNPLI